MPVEMFEDDRRGGIIWGVVARSPYELLYLEFMFEMTIVVAGA